MVKIGYYLQNPLSSIDLPVLPVCYYIVFNKHHMIVKLLSNPTEDVPFPKNMG